MAVLAGLGRLCTEGSKGRSFPASAGSSALLPGSVLPLSENLQLGNRGESLQLRAPTHQEGTCCPLNVLDTLVWPEKQIGSGWISLRFFLFLFVTSRGAEFPCPLEKAADRLRSATVNFSFCSEALAKTFDLLHR